MKARRWMWLHLAALAALAALSGCVSAPTTQWLSLPLPAGRAPSVFSQGTTSRVLIVRRVGIPEYLQTDRVRYRRADSVLAEWPHIAWAERLEVGMTDHLVMRLRLALPGWQVCERACVPLATSVVLTVAFAPLDHVRALGQLQATAHWQLNGLPRQGATAITVAVLPDNAEGQAAALGQVLDRLSEDIAASVFIAP